jgi:hypothetical protein
VGKGERWGGFGQKAFFFLSPPPPTNQAEAGEGGSLGRPVGANPGEPGHGGGRAVGQNGEGAEGVLIPCSP